MGQILPSPGPTLGGIRGQPSLGQRFGMESWDGFTSPKHSQGCLYPLLITWQGGGWAKLVVSACAVLHGERQAPQGGRSPGGFPVAPLQGTQLSAAFLWMHGERNQRTCTRKPLNFANAMLINAFITQGGRDVQRQQCGWEVLLGPALLTLRPKLC